MSILFIPRQGMVLMCDFDTGFVPPEITKVRHVIVVSPRHRRNSGSCLVVPLSTVAPQPVEPFHYRIPANTYSFFRKNADVWAKADLFSHVSFGRLDRVLDGGKYCSPMLNRSDLEGVQHAVWEALGRPTVRDLSATVVEFVETRTTKVVVDKAPKATRLCLEVPVKSGLTDVTPCKGNPLWGVCSCGSFLSRGISGQSP